MNIDSHVVSGNEPTRVFRQGSKKPLGSAEAISLSDILNDQSTPPPPIIDEGVLLDGTLLLLVGPPKARKSFLVMNFAIAIAAGVSFAGFKIPRARRVLLLTAEGGLYPTMARIKKMCKTVPVGDLKNFWLRINPRPQINFGDPESMKRLEEEVRKHEIEVLIIDPFVRFHCADENSATQITGVLSAIRALMEANNLSVILVHHTGKKVESGPRGSSAIVSDYDSRIQLEKEGDVHTLTFDMRHVVTPEPRDVKFNAGQFWFETGKLSQIQSILRQNANGMPRQDLVRRIEQVTNVKEATAYKNVKKAEESGAIEERDGMLFWKN